MLSLGLAAALLLATPASPEAVQKTAAEVLASKDYQKDLPTDPTLPEFKLPTGPLLVVLRVLLWAAVAVILALLGVWLARTLGRYVRDAKVQEPPLPPPSEVTRLPLTAAEALALQGRFGDAVHVLLLRTLEVLSGNLPAPLSPSFTSREVLARIPLRDPAREALTGLISAVEVSHFGGAEVTAGDYQICLDRFHRFAAAYQGGA
jgi:hypothetical protein